MQVPRRELTDADADVRTTNRSKTSCNTALKTNLQRFLTMPPKAKLNVHSFPRPPLLERTPRHLVIKWNNKVIADTTDGYWALETTHPPS